MPPDEVVNQVDDAKIVRTGEMELEVTDVTVALTGARDGIRAMGGYIGASETQTLDDSPFASVTYRVPVARWEDALDLLRGLTGGGGKVLNERTNAVEVTGAVVDLEARIRNLRASEAALQDIASKAVRISDVLEVQAQLTSRPWRDRAAHRTADPARGPGGVRHDDGAVQRPGRGGAGRGRRAGSRPRSSTRRRRAWSTSSRRSRRRASGSPSSGCHCCWSSGSSCLVVVAVLRRFGVIGPAAARGRTGDRLGVGGLVGMARWRHDRPGRAVRPDRGRLRTVVGTGPGTERRRAARPARSEMSRPVRPSCSTSGSGPAT